jgi:tRNA(Ile)-lysidine synthase
MLNLETFKAYWDKHFPDVRLKRSHFVLAVSGGVDSVVLAHLMHAVNANCTIAHVNFQLRGTESERDEQFVRGLASALKMPIEVHSCETAKYAETYKMGIQQAAREIRYAWFGALMQKIEAQEKNIDPNAPPHALPPQPKPVVLLTAHHADDQVETVLMQLFRGTGLHGLTGIPARRTDLLNMARPLIAFTKEEIKSYAKIHQLNYVEDSSNEKNDYTRNLIRNTLLPQIAEVYPMVSENILATTERLKEAEQIVSDTVAQFWKKGFKKIKGVPSISIDYWNKVKGNATFTWGLIQQFGFKSQQIQEVHKILTAQKGAFIASSTHKLIHWDNYIQIVPLNDSKCYLCIESPDSFISGAKWTAETEKEILYFELIDNTNLVIEKEASYAYLDASKLEWPLLLRSWEPTDYFYPFGMQKKKKLNHFLGNLKLSPAIKASQLVLTNGPQICWVVGKRIDDRFKIKSTTKQVLKIHWKEFK